MPEKKAEDQMTDAQVNAVESAVWKQLSARRWFGKHVEEEEMEALETDLRDAIRFALTQQTEAPDA